MSAGEITEAEIREPGPLLGSEFYTRFREALINPRHPHHAVASEEFNRRCAMDAIDGGCANPFASIGAGGELP